LKADLKTVLLTFLKNWQLWKKAPNCISLKSPDNILQLRIVEKFVGYKKSEASISEMDKLECYRLGRVRLV